MGKIYWLFLTCAIRVLWSNLLARRLPFELYLRLETSKISRKELIEVILTGANQGTNELLIWIIIISGFKIEVPSPIQAMRGLAVL